MLISHLLKKFKRIFQVFFMETTYFSKTFLEIKKTLEHVFQKSFWKEKKNSKHIISRYLEKFPFLMTLWGYQKY